MRNTTERLVRDYRSHVRAMQMSRMELFIYCEGRSNDPYVYSEIARRALGNNSVGFLVLKAEDVEGKAGKAGVLSIYDEHKKRRLLQSDFKGKKFICLFFVDKDVDDIARRMRRSDHVMYTNFYDLEAEIFHDTDLPRAIAVTTSVDTKNVPHGYKDAMSWIKLHADRWKEWLVLCLFSRVYDLDCGCGYGRAFAIHDDWLGDANVARFDSFKRALYAKSQWDQRTFDVRFSAMERRVDELQKKGLHAKIFKGKWLAPLLRKEIDRGILGENIRVDAFEARLLSSATAFLKFNSHWSRSCQARVVALIQPILSDKKSIIA